MRKTLILVALGFGLAFLATPMFAAENEATPPQVVAVEQQQPEVAKDQLAEACTATAEAQPVAMFAPPIQALHPCESCMVGGSCTACGPGLPTCASVCEYGGGKCQQGKCVCFC